MSKKKTEIKKSREGVDSPIFALAIGAVLGFALAVAIVNVVDVGELFGVKPTVECKVFWIEETGERSERPDGRTVVWSSRNVRTFDNEKDAKFFMRHLKAVRGGWDIKGYVTKRYVRESVETIDLE